MITISLCMIVKNEETVLPRILEQVKEIADEIIIVDTGSSDQTKSITKQYTDLVFDYPWNQDFASARNFACSKASMDYWMWLDADDFITPDNLRALLEFKKSFDPSVDIVMMKYAAGFDENGSPSFLYYRERLIKNRQGFLWSGRVHEVVTPRGKILYSPIEIEHRKIKDGDSDRNLKIYEDALKDGEKLDPRHQFYYGRELFFHQRYEEAVGVFQSFLAEPEAWVENQIDACLQLSRCLKQLGRQKECLAALFYSFSFDVPRAEICCETGSLMMERNDYRQAVFWYKEALLAKNNDCSGAFIQSDCYGYIPSIQLCVCYDRLGEHEKAFEYHKLSQKLKPEAKAVKQNQIYFERLKNPSPASS